MIAFKSKENEKVSSMTRFLNFLIKIRFIPVKIDNDKTKASFKLCNIQTFTFAIVYLGILTLPFLGVTLIYGDIFNIAKKMFEKDNIIDTLSMLFLFGFSSIEFTATHLSWLKRCQLYHPSLWQVT